MDAFLETIQPSICAFNIKKDLYLIFKIKFDKNACCQFEEKIEDQKKGMNV